MIQKLFARAAIAATIVSSLTTLASAADLQPGLYRLNNHPDGNSNPPPYGARFDELYNATGDHDIFTLDFDDLNSSVFLTINAAQTEIRIFGQALGGRDIGSVHANDIYFGVYTFDFVYNLGVTPVPNDDDLEVVGPNHQNFGSITAPNGLGTTTLTDESMGGHSFQLGDEDGPGPIGGPGHRGWNGISGWGWMSYVYPTGIVHEPATDWLFTATYVIPTPGASAILGLGGLALLRRRR